MASFVNGLPCLLLASTVHRLNSRVYLTPCVFIAPTQNYEQVQKTMTEQQQVTTQLMQERQLLQQHIKLLQQQSRDQADQLRRTRLQKQRLEGLCRTLQVCSHQ
jgi:septal ring factor EnvC (AmiA/AmiB activator)